MVKFNRFDSVAFFSWEMPNVLDKKKLLILFGLFKKKFFWKKKFWLTGQCRRWLLIVLNFSIHCSLARLFRSRSRLAIISLCPSTLLGSMGRDVVACFTSFCNKSASDNPFFRLFWPESLSFSSVGLFFETGLRRFFCLNLKKKKFSFSFLKFENF